MNPELQFPFAGDRNCLHLVVVSREMQNLESSMKVVFVDFGKGYSQNLKAKGHFTCNLQRVFLWLLAAGISQSANVLGIVPQNHASAIRLLLPCNRS